MDLVVQGRQLHQQAFGCVPEWCSSAPGRVNLIGEHTDYNKGSLSSKYTLRLQSSSYPEIHSIDIKELYQTNKCSHWSDYIRGVIVSYHKKHHSALFPMDVTICSNIPIGAGLSSSAAIEIAMAFTLERIMGHTPDPPSIAKLCQLSDWEYCNVPCGIMDQYISACGRKGTAMLLDCRNLEPQFIPLDDSKLGILIVNSNVKHALCGGEYALRTEQCAAAVEAMKELIPAIKSLREVSLDQLTSIPMDPLILARARHVISENNRTLEFRDCVVQRDYTRAGTLMYESHNSLRDDYEVSCAELDFIVDTLSKHEGVIGARMTGGGFGGSCVALVRVEQANAIIEYEKKLYKDRFLKEPAFVSTSPDEGAKWEDMK